MGVDKYVWTPPGLSTVKTEAWMRNLPDEKVPLANSPGETYWTQQKERQMPKQDLDAKHCEHLAGKGEKDSFQAFISARDEIALDTGIVIDTGSPAARKLTTTPLKTTAAKQNQQQHQLTIRVTADAICCGCEKALAASSGLGVAAARLGSGVFWHPGCFKCTTCEELLVDLTYCIYNDDIYCERHFAEQLKPRCGKCDELIFSGEYVEALGKRWHCGHFACKYCDIDLTGCHYALGPGQIPCCIPCYEKNHQNECVECNKEIGLSTRDIAYQDKHWHEDCFSCKKCLDPLVGKPFAIKNKMLFCEKCYSTEFAARCDTCGEAFRPGTKKMEYKNRKWHDKCFTCTVCKEMVGTKPFIIPNENDVFCVPCFEEKFATKCKKCSKIMTKGGVTYKNEAWHRDCFTCAHCDSQLTGQKFAARNDLPYCAKCFGDLFAKRCTTCKAPITGTGGTKFITYDGKHWHSECFKCGFCEESMAGKGFIQDGEDIICPDCATKKCMAPN